jgi:hypothetical protein
MIYNGLTGMINHGVNVSADGIVSQFAQPFTDHGRPYMLAVDELGSGGARVFDIRTLTRPRERRDRHDRRLVHVPTALRRRQAVGVVRRQRRAKGTAADAWFLKLMIRHHEGGLIMARPRRGRPRSRRSGRWPRSSSPSRARRPPP